MLISLLMTGSTDSAIANTLNINVRSVRRWISDLMDELGSRLACSLARHLSDQMVCAASLVGVDREPQVGFDRDHAVIPFNRR